MTSIGFIGSGRIARIMLEGWKRAGALPATIKVHDTTPELAAALAAKYPGVVPATLAEVARQSIVVVGLHPPIAAEVLPRIAAELRPDAIVLSLAPKLRFAKLTELLGGFSRLARQNPNAPSIIDHGYNPIAFADTLDAAGRQTLRTLLEPLGACPEVDEHTIEAYALISCYGADLSVVPVRSVAPHGRRVRLVGTGGAPGGSVHGAWRHCDAARIRLVDRTGFRSGAGEAARRG